MTALPERAGESAIQGALFDLPGGTTSVPGSVLAFEGITKAFFGIHALRDVSFSVRRGHVLGLVGENGAGKSTLMNILGGVVQADSGRIVFNGQEHQPRNPQEAARSGIAFIHQELNLFTNLSVAENMFIGGFPRLGGLLPLIDRRRMARTTGAALQNVNLDVSPDTLVESLTPGERQLVEIAKALQEDASLIIFDEPTTSLTVRETERLFEIIGRLRNEGRSIIYISHILGDVRRLCDDLVVLRDGRVVATGAQDEYPVRRMIAAMVGRDIELLYPERISKPTDEPVLEVRDVSQPGVVKGIEFALHRGEILGLFGLMGSGRSELARILFGLDPFATGEVVLNGEPYVGGDPRRSIQRGLSFVTENRREEGLLLDVTIAENLGLV
ncbi:MAG: sugar ABC transporter ATP-binding protein, partial [Chloroflexi bacterium]|nr:sugar ABC transporter ATP-binding protein [Chloroflexota bacterium]